MDMDRDLQSIQEARDLAQKARKAFEQLEHFSQEKIDRIVAEMAKRAEAEAERLARLAVEDTGLGVVEHKVQKNLFAARNVYNAIKDLKTVGFIREDNVNKVYEIAEPMGVIMGIIPTTNPTSTIIYKALISIKARNTIVFSPHPNAVKCSLETARVLEEAGVSAGAPPGCVQCLSIITKEGTNALMHHPDIALILATGGSAMVKAAYSAGKPAIGVGPGNVPAYIESSADIKKAVSDIFASKTFDNGVICASEQAIIVDANIEKEVREEVVRQGGYFLSKDEIRVVEKILFSPKGLPASDIVGQSAQFIARKAGITVPDNTRLLVAELDGVGPAYPLSKEKLSPVIAFYVEKDWRSACERCIEMLEFGGMGHTLVIHSNNEDVIREFALRKPAFRILVNTPGSQGAIGGTTGLFPSLTLGCGTWGGSITADNVGPHHLMNIKRLAYEIRPVEPVKVQVDGRRAVERAVAKRSEPVTPPPRGKLTEEEIERIVREFLKQRGRR